MAKYKCKCGGVFDVHKLTLKLSGGEFLPFVNGKQLSCPICKSLEVVQVLPEGDIKITLLDFAMKTKQEKRAVLKKRSNDHFKKEIRENKIEQDLSHLKK